MAVKTIESIGSKNGSTISIAASDIVSQIGENKKIINAILKLNNAILELTNATINESSIFASCGCGEKKLIDQIKPCTNRLLCLNITHAIDCILKNSLTQTDVFFSDSTINYSRADIEIEYISQQVMFQNNTYINVDANNAGNGTINVATGQLRFQNAGLIYNGWQANKQSVIVGDSASDKADFNTHCGKGWKLGVQQYLIRHQNGNASEYTYVDGDGNFHRFTEKYYYMDGEKRHYVAKDNVTVDLNGNLTYDGHEVKIDRRSTDDLSLETDYTSFVNGHLIEQRQDEQIQLEENISALENQLKQYVLVQKDTGDVLNHLKKSDGTLNDGILFAQSSTENKIILTESEAIQYRSLLLQQNTSNPDNTISLNLETSEIIGTSAIEASSNVFTEVAPLQSGSQFLTTLKSKLAELKNALLDLTKKKNFSADSSSPNYQYIEYIKYLDRHQYTKTVKCCLDGIKSLAKDAYITEITQGTSDTVTDLEIPYTHLYNNLCDLQAELDRINDDLAEYNRNQSPDTKDNSVRQKVLEQRLRVFQKEFNTKIDHIQVQISVLEKVITDFTNKEQEKLLRQQLQLLVNQAEVNITDVKNYYKKYVNAKHQLETLYRQMPTSFVTDGEKTLGFNKFGQFVAMFDNYGNQTSIVYENDKIVSIRDTDGNETTFKYNKVGLLAKIIDSKEKVTQFFYTDDLLTRIVAPNEEEYAYTYCTENHTLHGNISCTNHELQTVEDHFHRKIQFVYDEYCRVKEIKKSSKIYSVSNNQVLYNDNTNDDENDAVYASVTLKYNSTTSTTVTDENGVVTTYIFDTLGKPVTMYEGASSSPQNVTKAVTFEYVDNKQSYAIQENPSATNLLKNLAASNTLTSSGPTKQLVYNVSAISLPARKTDFVFSAWAKADSAYIPNARKADPYFDTIAQANNLYLDSNQAGRKFELRAEVCYTNGDCETFAASFDWLNTGWQYLALPIEIEEYADFQDALPGTLPFIVSSSPRTLSQIKLFVDFSYNMILIETDCLALREGDWTYSTFDENGRKITEQDSKTESQTLYTYDDNNRVVESTIIDRLHRKFTNTYEYNKQGNLVRTTNYNGLVEETVYDDKGNVVKKITYNLDDPTSKLYNESKRDDKGNLIADIDQSGQYDSTTYTYDHTGAATVQADGNGNATSFGYKDGNLVSVSSSADGEESTNTLRRTAGLVTKVSNGDTDYTYSYDGQNRQTSVGIAGQTHSATVYTDKNTATTTLANRDKFTRKTDKYGNVIEQSTTFANGETEKIVNIFDEYHRLSKTTVDNTATIGYNVVNSYDANGNLVSQVRGGNYALSKVNAYTSDNQLQSTTYTVSQQQLAYVYETDQTPDKRNAKVTLPFNVQQAFSYDGIGRTRSISLGENLSKDIYYAKYGDHATNRINSIWFGVNGVRKDNTRYTYDKAGNIATVTENGKLVAKYTYDGLNRLVRQDDINFGTVTYKYDHAGNITCKTTYALTFDETLGTPVETQEYTYRQRGWQDQLVNLNGQSFEYDAIGNPTLYCGKAMTWQGRRLLSYNGSTFTYDVDGMRTTKTANNVTIAYYYDDGNLVAERRTTENASSWLYYLYGVDGIAGFRYNSTTYLFRKNIQGDVTHIYTESGTLVGQYAYDAWGNCATLQDTNGIATLNPFRYRSYYFDQENDLYYLQSRYYDPETCRFVNADDIFYLDPETIGGLNLYAYCGNNPVMAVDPEGTAWWHWLLGAVGVVLIAVIAVAVTAATAGASSFVFAVALGALKGAAIGLSVGAAAGATIGAIVGGIIANDNKTDFWTGVGEGALLGLGIGAFAGAIIGAVIGGFSGANSWYNTKALEFTNYGSNEVVLGRSPGYVEYAEANGATYFHTSESVWDATSSMTGVGHKGMWQINKAFLKQQIKAGAHFTLLNEPSGFFYAKEVAYIIKHTILYTFL